MSVNVTNLEFLAAVNECVEKAPRLEVRFDWEQFFCVVAACQLALRHPSFPCHSAAVLERCLRRALVTVRELSPVVGAILEAGFDRRQDVELIEAVFDVVRCESEVPH